LTIQDVTNVTISGYGATLTMPKSEYTTGEWRHALAILGSSNVTIQGLACNNSGGDGVYIGGDGTTGSYSENITIKDVTCDNNRRNGMSITSAQDVLVISSSFINSNGTNPQEGVDLEPNWPTDRLVNIRFENCVTAGNVNSGFDASLGNLNSTSQPVSITFSNDRDSASGGSGCFILGAGKANPVTGTISFTNFTSQSAGEFGVYVYDWGGVSLTFSGLTIINPDQAGNPSFTVGIAITQPSGAGVPGGNVFIPSSTISDSTGKMKYYFNVADRSGLGYQHLQIAHGTWSGALYDPYGLYLGQRVTSVATDPLITKSVDKNSASSGDTLTYTINYSNPTTNTFSNAKIEDLIPNGTTYVQDSATGGVTFDGSKIILNIGNLAAGASGSVQFQVRVQ
jgi:uncharacterized repeat protein (TIGR01451 family)